MEELRGLLIINQAGFVAHNIMHKKQGLESAFRRVSFG
jgi:hypothetical protein